MAIKGIYSFIMIHAMVHVKGHVCFHLVLKCVFGDWITSEHRISFEITATGHVTFRATGHVTVKFSLKKVTVKR